MRRRRTSCFPIAATIGLAGVLLWPTPAYAAPRCFGKAATIVGTAHRDKLNGTSGRDVIVGLGKGDRINGRGGRDLLCGGNGSDVLVGLAGDDALSGNGGDDTLAGGDGDDALDGGAGFDFAENYFKNAFIQPFNPLAGPMNVNLATGTSTGNGTDTLKDIEGASGSLGNDVMTGNAEDNNIVALNEGFDVVDAGAGDDLVDGGDEADDLDGGAGTDVLANLDATAGMAVNLSVPIDSHGDTLAGFENLIGTPFNDVLNGTDGPNEIEGADGDDNLSGQAGDDVLIAGGGVDSADGGAGTDACDAETVANCET